MLVMNCCVPCLFYTDMVSQSLLSVAKKPRLGFAELHVRVKTEEVLFRCDTTFCHSGCVVIVECSATVAAGNGGHL
jgi:hypothetical protein